MNLGGSIRHGTKWLFGGNLAGQILQVAFGIVLARLLDPADFGMLVTIQIFTGLAAFVAGAGMGQALVQSKTASPRDFHAVFTLQLLLGFCIYSVFFTIAPLFAIWFGDPLYRDLLRVAALFFVLRPFANLPNVWLTREMRFRERATYGLCGVAVSGTVSISMALLGYQVWSLVIGGMAGTILISLVMIVRVPVRPRLRVDVQLVKQIGAYGFKTTLNDFLSYLTAQAPNFLLSRLGGPAVVGIYNKAESLSKTPGMLSAAVYDPIFRGMATIRDNDDQCRYVYLRTVTLLSVYMLPFFVLLGYLAEPLIVYVYGEKWRASAAPLSILCLGGIFSCIGHPGGAVLAARNWLGREAILHMICLALVLVATFSGLGWGLTGVAWALLFVHGYSAAHMYWLVSRCIGVRSKDLLKSLMPGVFLNLVLLSALLVTELLLRAQFVQMHNALFLLLMGFVGSAIYAVAFLYLPIETLANEQNRWKRKFALTAYG